MDLCLGILGELSLLKRCDNNHSVHIAPPSSVLSLTRLLTSYVCPLMNHLFILVLLSLCMSARINTSSSPQCIQSFFVYCTTCVTSDSGVVVSLGAGRWFIFIHHFHFHFHSICGSISVQPSWFCLSQLTQRVQLIIGFIKSFIDPVVWRGSGEVFTAS